VRVQDWVRVQVQVPGWVRRQAPEPVRAQAQERRANHCRLARQHRLNCSTRRRMKQGGQGTGS